MQPSLNLLENDYATNVMLTEADRIILYGYSIVLFKFNIACFINVFRS